MPFLDSKRSLALGVFAAIGASVCCVGPLLLLTLGISGAWVGSLAAFEPYRPLFIGLVLIFFALALRKLYLIKPACVPDTHCAKPYVLMRQRVTFWVAAVLTLGLLAIPWVAPLFI